MAGRTSPPAPSSREVMDQRPPEKEGGSISLSSGAETASVGTEEPGPAGQSNELEAAPGGAKPQAGASLSTPEILDRREQDRQLEPTTPEFQRGALIQPGQGVIQPSVLGLEKPEYPQVARRLGLEGLIHASVLVDENGEVAEVRFSKGHQGFRDSIKKALKKAKFNPATKNGVPGKMWIELSFHFEL